MIPAHTKRLAAKINQPGGITEKEAVTAAVANLETLRERTQQEVDVTIRKIRAAAQALGSPPNPAAVHAVYGLSNAVVGLAGVYGMTGLSAVAYSLCELVDRLRTARVWDARAVAVHIDSLVLMHAAVPGKEQEAEIQAALRRLLDRIPI